MTENDVPEFGESLGSSALAGSPEPPVEDDARWGVTWVGGVLRYDSREEAERKQRAFGSGAVVPPETGDSR